MPINKTTLPKDQNGESFYAANKATFHKAVAVTYNTRYALELDATTHKNVKGILVHNNTGGIVYYGGADVNTPAADPTKQGVPIANGSSDTFTATVGFTLNIMPAATGYIVITYFCGN